MRRKLCGAEQALMGEASRDRKDAAEAAAQWFVRLSGEAATGEDWLAFEDWLKASPVHAEAYARVERLSAELDDQAPRLLSALAEPRRAGARWAWPGAGAALAAAIALAALIGVRGSGPAPTAYQAPPGTIREIALSDGSRVRLDAASALSVRMTGRSRQVAMADGEAAFDVAHDPARPFLIRVGDRQVRVVGTEFDLRHRGGVLTLTVRRGVVEVRPAEASGAPVRLQVAEQLTHRDGTPGDAVAKVDADEAFGWTEGQLVYHARPLAEVAADLSRRFGEPIRPADAATGRTPFTGVLVTDSEPAVLRRLKAFAGVSAERTAQGVVLKRDRKP
jgi:transmembrane sensor